MTKKKLRHMIRVLRMQLRDLRNDVGVQGAQHQQEIDTEQAFWRAMQVVQMEQTHDIRTVYARVLKLERRIAELEGRPIAQETEDLDPERCNTHIATPENSGYVSVLTREMTETESESLARMNEGRGLLRSMLHEWGEAWRATCAWLKEVVSTEEEGAHE